MAIGQLSHWNSANGFSSMPASASFSSSVSVIRMAMPRTMKRRCASSTVSSSDSVSRLSPAFSPSSVRRNSDGSLIGASNGCGRPCGGTITPNSGIDGSSWVMNHSAITTSP